MYAGEPEKEEPKKRKVGKDFLLQEMIEKIREKGFPVAVDDFGSGYSTLGFVRDIEFDTLKMDRSFLRGDIEEKKRSRGSSDLQKSLE